MSVRPIDRRASDVVDEVLRVMVDRLTRLLDDQDRGVVEIGPSQRDAELLVWLEIMAELADDRVVAVWQVLNEVVGMGDLGGLDDARQGIHGIAQPDVDQHGIGEDQVGLEHGGDLGADRVECRFAKIAAIDQHPAGLGVGQPGDEASQGQLRIVVESHQGGP